MDRPHAADAEGFEPGDHGSVIPLQTLPLHTGDQELELPHNARPVELSKLEIVADIVLISIPPTFLGTQIM